MAATKSYLQALSKVALALPGIAIGANTLGADDVVLDYKHLYYKEKDLMQVSANYLSLGAKINDNNDLNLTLEYESMSGASPIFITPGPDGTLTQVTSGASITDKRTAGSLRYSHYLSKGVISITPSVSSENDYESRAITAEYQWDQNNKNTSFSIGSGYAQDTVGATGQDLDEDRKGVSIFGGVTQVLDRQSLLQFNVSLAKESGYLSDPYKLTLVEGSIIQDNRPDERQQAVLLTRYIRYFGEASGSMHLSYRFYHDDWSINAHTLEASWNQELPQSWLLTPSLRYYSQEKASFYEPFFTQARADGIHSSDYRLASFGSILAGFKAAKTFNKNTNINLNVEYYERNGELKLGGDYSVDPEPLKSYAITFGIKHTF